MSTPLGHALAGAAAANLSPAPASGLGRRLAAGAVAGTLPDLDFLPGLLMGDPSRFHHGPTHSLAFVLLVGAAAWMLAARHRWRWALATGAAVASHLMLDALTGDPAPPVGLQLLWPLSDAYVLSPITPLPRIFHTTVSPFSLHNLGVAAMELAVFGGAAWWSVRRSRRFGE